MIIATQGDILPMPVVAADESLDITDALIEGLNAAYAVDSLAYVLTVNGAERRNSQAWPRWGEYVWPNYYIADNFADEVSYLKQWLSDRIAWMDEQLDYDPTAYQRGDVDGDGNVNISDVTALIDYLLSGDAANVNTANADCDEDGNINIADVTALIDQLLGS